MAKLKCGDGTLMTIDEVYQLCNTQDPLQIPRCGLPVTYKCGLDEVNYIVSLNGMGPSFGQLALAIAPPVSMPFVRVLMDLPNVPTYNLFKDMDVRNDTLAFVAMTSITTEQNGINVPFDLSGGVNFESCAGGTFTIGGSCDNCDYELVDGKSLDPVSVVASQPNPVSCDLASVQLFRDYLNTTVYRLQGANSEAEFSKGINTLNLVTNMDGYVGCEASINSIVQSGPVAIPVSDVRGCYLDYYSPDFLKDPCCNPQLQFRQCCALRTAVLNVTELQDIDYSMINSTVPPAVGDSWTEGSGYVPGPTRQIMLNAAVNALNEYVQAEHADDDPQYGCRAGLQSLIPPDFLSKSTSFLDKCFNIIGGGLTVSGSKSGKCASDADCYTSCNLQTHKCTYPTSTNSLNAYVACALDKMTPDVLLYVRDQLGVPSSPPDTFAQRLSAKMSDVVTDTICDGPDEYSAGACLLTMPSSTCESLAAVFPDSRSADDTFPDIKITSLDSATAGESAMPDSSADPYDFQFLVVRKDIRRREECADAMLQWVNVSFGDMKPFSACRVPLWSPSGDGSQAEGRIAQAQAEQSRLARFGKRSSVRRRAIAKRPLFFVKTDIHPHVRDDGRYNESTVLDYCSQRRQMEEDDPCSPYLDYFDLYSACSTAVYYMNACGAQPDPENMFDPSSNCTTLTNRMQYSQLTDPLPGVGSCKVTNFGYTSGLLPTGYMSSSMIDWHSEVSTYEDQNFNLQNISSDGASIAQTRCTQIGNAVSAMGFSLSVSHWYRYTTRTESVYDPDSDDYVDITFPGNKTLCEMEKKCNSDLPDLMDHNKKECLEMSPVRM